jgi:hypothetical protein
VQSSLKNDPSNRATWTVYTDHNRQPTDRTYNAEEGSAFTVEGGKVAGSGCYTHSDGQQICRIDKSTSKKGDQSSPQGNSQSNNQNSSGNSNSSKANGTRKAGSKNGSGSGNDDGGGDDGGDKNKANECSAGDGDTGPRRSPGQPVSDEEAKNVTRVGRHEDITNAGGPDGDSGGAAVDLSPKADKAEEITRATRKWQQAATSGGEVKQRLIYDPPNPGGVAKVARAATVLAVTGSAQRMVVQNGQAKWVAVKKGDRLGQYSIVRTGLGSGVDLQLPNGQQAHVNSATKMGISDLGRGDGSAHLTLKYGGVGLSRGTRLTAAPVRVETPAGALRFTGDRGKVSFDRLAGLSLEGRRQAWRAAPARVQRVVRAGARGSLSAVPSNVRAERPGHTPVRGQVDRSRPLTRAELPGFGGQSTGRPPRASVAAIARDAAGTEGHIGPVMMTPKGSGAASRGSPGTSAAMGGRSGPAAPRRLRVHVHKGRGG